MTLIVNGEKIEDSVIRQEVERLRPDYERVFEGQDPAEQKSQLFDWSRENVIERVLISQYAAANCKRVSEAEVESTFAEAKKQYEAEGRLPKELSGEDVRRMKEEIELQLRVEKLLRDVCERVGEPSKEAVLKFYEENRGQFKSPEQVRVGHIVKHTDWQTDEAAAFSIMRKAEDELKAGVVFETLAAKYSDCPENGGDLGYITRGQMVEEFEDVVFNLGVQEVSGIFHTRFGFHIAKVYDRKVGAVCGLEEVRASIVNELKEQRRRKAVDDFIDELRSGAKIEEI